MHCVTGVIGEGAVVLRTGGWLGPRSTDDASRGHGHVIHTRPDRGRHRQGAPTVVYAEAAMQLKNIKAFIQGLGDDGSEHRALQEYYTNFNRKSGDSIHGSCQCYIASEVGKVCRRDAIQWHHRSL